MSLRIARLLIFGVLLAWGGSAPSYARPSPKAPVTWLIFVDDLHVDFGDTGYLRNLLRSIATELIRDGDSFLIRSSGPSALSLALDSNRAVLDASISKASGNELVPSDCLSIEVDDEMRYRAEVAGTAASEMLNNVPKNTVGRVALLYISDGYPRLPAAASIAGVPRVAHQSAVTVFALNPRALRRTPQVVPPVAPVLGRCYRDDVMLKSLRAIAEPTGGFSVLEAADFADAFQRIGRVMREPACVQRWRDRSVHTARRIVGFDGGEWTLRRGSGPQRATCRMFTHQLGHELRLEVKGPARRIDQVSDGRRSSAPSGEMADGIGGEGLDQVNAADRRVLNDIAK